MAVIRHETICENTGFVPLCRFAKRFDAEIRDVTTHDEMSSMARSNRYGDRRAAAIGFFVHSESSSQTGRPFAGNWKLPACILVVGRQTVICLHLARTP